MTPEPSNEYQKLVEAAAKAGWEACRRQVYVLNEDTEQKYGSFTPLDSVQGAFARGRVTEAKSIAKALHALGADNCDELQSALSALKLPHAGDDGWQDIATAPKTGERFIAACVCATSGERWVTGDVWWHLDHWCSDGDGSVAITHWRPLPHPSSRSKR